MKKIVFLLLILAACKKNDPSATNQPPQNNGNPTPTVNQDNRLLGTWYRDSVIEDSVVGSPIISTRATGLLPNMLPLGDSVIMSKQYYQTYYEIFSYPNNYTWDTPCADSLFIHNYGDYNTYSSYQFSLNGATLKIVSRNLFGWYRNYYHKL